MNRYMERARRKEEIHMEEKILAAIAALGERVDEQFNKIDKRFEDIDQRFESIDQRFESIDQHFERIDKRFESIDKRFDTLERDVKELNSRVSTLEIGQRETHLMLNALLEASEKNSAEIDNLRLTTASADALNSLRNTLSDGFTSLGEQIRDFG